MRQKKLDAASPVKSTRVDARERQTARDRLAIVDSPRRRATYDDIVALPANVTGQIVFGVLHAFPRPAPKHTMAASALGQELGPPFQRGRGGPGGWVILDEPDNQGRWGMQAVVSPDQAHVVLPLDFIARQLRPTTERTALLLFRVLVAARCLRHTRGRSASSVDRDG